MTKEDSEEIDKNKQSGKIVLIVANFSSFDIHGFNSNFLNSSFELNKLEISSNKFLYSIVAFGLVNLCNSI